MHGAEIIEEVLIYPSKETVKKRKEEAMLLPEAISKLVVSTVIASSSAEATDLVEGSLTDPCLLLDEPACSLVDSLRSNLPVEALVHSAKATKVEVTIVLITATQTAT